MPTSFTGCDRVGTVVVAGRVCTGAVVAATGVVATELEPSSVALRITIAAIPARNTASAPPVRRRFIDPMVADASELLGH